MHAKSGSKSIKPIKAEDITFELKTSEPPSIEEVQQRTKIDFEKFKWVNWLICHACYREQAQYFTQRDCEVLNFCGIYNLLSGKKITLDKALSVKSPAQAEILNVHFISNDFRSGKLSFEDAINLNDESAKKRYGITISEYLTEQKAQVERREKELFSLGRSPSSDESGSYNSKPRFIP